MSSNPDDEKVVSLFGRGRRGDVESGVEEAVDTLKYLIAGGFIGTGTLAVAAVYGRSLWFTALAIMGTFMEDFG